MCAARRLTERSELDLHPVALSQHSYNFEEAPYCGADCLVASDVTNGGLIMTIGGLTSSEQTKAISAASAINDVRTLIADHLGVSIARVIDEAHFTDDLGADWLDRLDLMIAVEDQFAGVEITDDDVDRIEVVGDLIRHIETLDGERRRRGAAPVIRNLFGPRLARANKANQARRASSVFLRLAGDAMRSLTGWCRET